MAEPARFALPEELEEFRRLVREIAEDKVAPRAAEIDRTDEWPEDLYRVLVENELMAVGYPEEYGGSGGGSLAFGLLIEELSRVSAGFALTPLVARLGAIPVLLAGTEEQRRDVVGRICRGQLLMSYALTEAGAGSDAAALSTRYARTDRGFVLTGTKRFITGAGVSHGYVVFATRDPALRADGISAFLVYRDDPGVSFGRPEHKMGIRGSPTREVILEEAEIPADRLIGEEGQGFAYAMRTLDRSRPTIGAQALGIAQGALDLAARYATERQQFGQRIADFQAIRFMLADMAMGVEASRLLVYRALAACDADDPRTTYLAAVAKCFASDVAMRVTTDAVQVLGGYGYVAEYPAERFMRDAKITQIYEGTNQIQRVVIARELLREVGGGGD
ncbi:MAG TPA: acyl-CoA dehydrogenase family protein [Actinomycetota bacterium]|nr:acyl-CoA dehydrogenase family protein [Actinomycetota bacterium]